MSPFLYGPVNIFLTPAWVELPSDSDSALFLKPLSYSEISSSYETHYYKKQNDDFFDKQTFQTILQKSLVSSRNFINFPNNQTIVEQLSPSDIRFLYNRLMEISTTSVEQLDAINEMLDIQFNPQFQDESWGCDLCQKKKLDYARACGFLPEDKRDPSPMLPRIGNRRFKQCPISLIDGYVTQQASHAHSLFIAGILPEDGGTGNQTEWFIKVALLYKRKVLEAERNALDASKNK